MSQNHHSDTEASSLIEVGPEITARPSTWRVWILATRPATLLACVVPVVVGTALAAAAGMLRVDAALAALCSAGFIQIGTNLFNDYADFKRGADTEDRLGPARATQRGWLTPNQVAVGAAVCFGLAVVLGAYLVWLSGWPLVAIGLLSVVCGVAYTGGPYPLAYNGLGELFVLLFFGFAAVCGTYFIQADSVSMAAVLASIPIGCLASAILVVNNLRDRKTDVVAGKKTLVVRFGQAAGRWEYVAFLAVSYLAVTLAWPLGWGGPGWLLPWLSLPLAIAQVRAIFRLDGAALNPHLGKTARLEMVFGFLLAVGVLL